MRGSSKSSGVDEKKIAVGMPAQVGDGVGRERRRKVLENLEARDQVVVAFELVGDRSH